MKEAKKITKKKEQGAVACWALAIMALLSLLGAVLAAAVMTEMLICASYRNGIAAQYLAETGATVALLKLKTDTAFTTSATGRQTEILLKGKLNEGTATSGSYSVKITSLADGSQLVVSTGIAGVSPVAGVLIATRQVIVSGKVRKNPQFPGGMSNIFLPERWSNVK